MKAPLEGGGSGGIVGELSGYTYDIEAILGDLMGIESVAQAFYDTFGANQTGNTASVPLGGGGAGAGAFYFDMPTRDPYHIAMLFARSEEDDQVKSEIQHYFNIGKGKASGIGEDLLSIVQHLSEVSPELISSAASDQQQALIHAQGRFIDDFANIGILVERHFFGGTSDAFLEWYTHVDDVLEELIFYGGVAQVAAAGTANTIKVAQSSILSAIKTARDRCDEVLQAWRGDPQSFPWPPGTAAKAMAEFNGLVDKVTDYASLIPGPIGKGADVVAEAKKVTGAAIELFGADQPKEFPVEPTSTELLAGARRAMTTIATDAQAALDSLAENSHPQAHEVSSRPFLSLKRLSGLDDPGWSYNDQEDR